MLERQISRGSGGRETARLVLFIHGMRAPPAITLCLALAAAACAKTSDRLAVISFAPKERSAGPDTTLIVQFDQAVVAESRVGEVLDDAPLAVDPPIASRAQWLDRRTLMVTPDAPLSPSTRYAVALTGELARRTGGFHFAFTHLPLRVTGIVGVPLDGLPPLPRLPVHFNQPVAAGEVVRHCRLEAFVGGDVIRLVVSDASQVADAIEVEPAAPLPRGERFRFVCEDLRGAGGNAPMDEPYSIELQTHAPLTARR